MSGKKTTSKSKSKALKQIASVWVRDPDTGRMLFNPTDRRFARKPVLSPEVPGTEEKNAR